MTFALADIQITSSSVFQYEDIIQDCVITNMDFCLKGSKPANSLTIFAQLNNYIYESRREKPSFLHMLKQRRRSASR